MDDKVKHAIEIYRNGKSIHKIREENGVSPYMMEKNLTLEDREIHEKNKETPARGWNKFVITKTEEYGWITAKRVKVPGQAQYNR